MFYSLRYHLLVFFLLQFLSFSLYSLNGLTRYSDNFYAAQKYFYQQAKLKYPKISQEKFYPEIPVKGNITVEELKKIDPMLDFFDARKAFYEEVQKYPEEIYPELLSFLNAHPALSVSPSNKAKFEALEKYFYPFMYVFTSDRHYSFSEDVKVNPCPIVFYMKDPKKNTIAFNVNNASKKSFDFMIRESSQGFLTVVNKPNMLLKPGSSNSVKLTVNLEKLGADSMMRTTYVNLSDPAQPKVKIIVPVILLPSKDFLNFPSHFFNLTYTYTTFFRHISLQKDKSTWPEPCPTGNCSGEKKFNTHHSDRLTSGYDFGELCTIRYNLITQANPYSSHINQLKFSFNELGNLEGMERNCPGSTAGSEVYCPPDALNNGKEIYGTRKLSFSVFLPEGKEYELNVKLSYSDLQNAAEEKLELSWLHEKKLVMVITGPGDKQVAKENFIGNKLNFSKTNIPSGIYKIEIFPYTADKEKLAPSFNIQHLNHGTKSRFDFKLDGQFSLIPHAKK